jgi:nicotinate-nucleotide adenylyltransferase
MKLGLYGGSFDPVHLGHLLVARAALEEVSLDRLFFIPAAQSPFKPDAQPTPAPLRLQLLRGALAGQTQCEVADHVASLPQWRDAAELARLAEFVVIPRPGQADTQFPAPFRGRSLRGFPLGVSSSQIRQRVQDGLPVAGLVPAAVAEAIRNAKLYL